MSETDPSKLFIDITHLESDFRALSDHIMKTLEVGKDLGLPLLGRKSSLYQYHTNLIKVRLESILPFISDPDSSQTENEKLLGEFQQYQDSILKTLEEYENIQFFPSIGYSQEKYLKEILDATKTLHKEVKDWHNHNLPKIPYFTASLVVAAFWALQFIGQRLSRGP